MFSSRRGRPTAAGLAVALLAVSCGGGGDDGGDAPVTTSSTTSSTTSTTTTVPEGPFAPLTGLPVGDRVELLDEPAIMVKISNNDEKSLEALIGIDQADVVIEERIEDRATRFAAIFHTNRPNDVGAVRSGRPADIDLMANLGTPIFLYSGAFSTVVRDIVNFAADGGAVEVVHDGTNTNIHRDDENFLRPDNLFVDLEFIFDKFGEAAGTAQPIFDYTGTDSAQASNAGTGDGVTITGRDTVSFVWDPSRGYVRVQDGAVHITQENRALVTDNVVVMETIYTQSDYDPRNVDAHTVGAGPVSVFTGGERWDGTWERDSRDDPYRFTDPDGDPILLEPGTTWLTLVPVDSYEFAVDDEIAALVLEADG